MAGADRDQPGGVATFHCDMAWLGDDEVATDVVIHVDGGTITGVQRGVAHAPTAATRLRGLTIPGLANAHSHAFHRALRGRAHGNRSFWTWRDDMYALAQGLDPESYHRLARATFAEMALAGVTGVGEFHYVHHGPGGTPYDDPNAMGQALIAAADEVGIRITLLDTCYLEGGIGTPLSVTQHRFSDGSADRWAERASEIRAEGHHARVGAAVHSVRAVDPLAMQVVATWGSDRNAPIHAHVSEQWVENEQCDATYGASPTAVFDDNGMLGPHFTAVHATHASGADLALLGRAGATCCLCPTTERDLADGIGPSRALRAAGVPVAVGSDSHAVIDLLEEARAVELHERLATGTRGNHETASLMRVATENGHACIGWPDAGHIAVGSLADFVTVSVDSVRLAGTVPDTALASVVFAGTAADVRQVVVGGRTIVRDAQHTTIDVAAELEAALS